MASWAVAREDAIRIGDQVAILAEVLQCWRSSLLLNQNDSECEYVGKSSLFRKCRKCILW
jgi:hypothetical protein